MRTTISINEDWLFTASQIDPALPDLSVMETVNLPHTWNAEDGSDGDDFYHRGVCWYAKKSFGRMENASFWKWKRQARLPRYI